LKAVDGFLVGHRGAAVEANEIAILKELRDLYLQQAVIAQPAKIIQYVL